MELWQDTVRRLNWAAAVANCLGGLLLFLLLGFLIPFAPEGPDRQLGLNAAVGAVYMATTLALGARLGQRLSEPIGRWLSQDRPPTDEERRLVLSQPLRFAVVAGIFWLGAAVLFTAINLPTSGWAALVVGGAPLMGGETTCAVSYLLAERIVRPVTVLALAGGDPPAARCGPGVAGRLSMAWSLGTGVPLLGILVIAIAGMKDPLEDPGLLAGAVALLAAVGLVVGMFAMNVASRSIAEPIAAVRRGIARIEAGDLDVSVPVDDGSEVGLLEAGFNRMVGGLRERERLRDLFGRHVGREVAQAALERDEVELGGELRHVAAVFVDLVGSTALAACRRPNEVVGLLNAFFTIVVESVEEHGGWVNKFEGDAALCIFGAPTERADAACDALRAARLMRDRLLRELDGVEAGIGVSAGPAVAGNVGTEERFEYTVIGDPVNEAARLCELAKERPERLLASASVVASAGEDEARHWVAGDSVVLRGRSEPTGLAAPSVSSDDVPLAPLGSPGAEG